MTKAHLFAALGCLVSMNLRAGAQAVPVTATPETDLAHQIVDTMFSVHGVAPGFRPVHAKGLVCSGTFTPTSEAAEFCKAPQFQSAMKIIARYSDGAPDPIVPDNSPNAGPRGLAIRFVSAEGAENDIVAISRNGFVVSTGEEFLALQKSVVQTDPSKPHPWPVEDFLAAHSIAKQFVSDNTIVPASFANEAFFGNDAFVFVNKSGARQPARLHILPTAGETNLSADDAKTKTPNFLIDELKTRLPTKPIEYRLVAQLPNPGDPTADPAKVWPADRKTITLGTIRVEAATPDSINVEKPPAFDPTNLPDGVELSDDPLPALRSSVYALSVARRNAK